MKKILSIIIIFISFNVYAETYRVDMDWYNQNTYPLINTSFFSSMECAANFEFLLTQSGQEFFSANQDLFADDINFATESMMKILMFAPNNLDELRKTPLNLNISNDKIEVEDLDLIFFKNDKNIVSKVEHKNKDVSKSFTFHNDSVLGFDNENNTYINYSWGTQDMGPMTCWYRLEKVQ